MSMVLQSRIGGDYKPHPEGIHPAICVDVIDLGLVESEFQGERRMVNKVRLAFESEQRTEEGKNCVVTKTFTASLHPKAKLAEFLGKWRGRAVVPGETIDLAKLVGANCTLVISHQQNMVGRTYASIDAVSKPTKKLVASGHYDPVAARQRIEERKAKEMQSGECRVQNGTTAAPRVRSGVSPQYLSPATPQIHEGLTPLTPAQASASPHAPPQKRGGMTPLTPAPVKEDYDPDVGF